MIRSLLSSNAIEKDPSLADVMRLRDERQVQLIEIDKTQRSDKKDVE